MASVDSTTITGLTKQVYDSRKIENLQNMETVIFKRIQKSPKKPTGQGFFMAVNTQGNQRGLGSQNELEALRTPKSQDPKKWKVLPKIITNTIRFSGLSLEIATSDVDSFADNYTFQMEEGLKDTMKEENAQVFRSGSGKVAQVNGSGSATATVTFDNGVSTHFRRGMFVDIITSGAVKEVTGIEVTDIDIGAQTITLASNQTFTDNSFIYRENVADDAPADGKELGGLPLVVDDGTISATYQGLDRTVFNVLDGISFSAGNANISNDILQRAISRVKIISGGRKPNVVVSNTSQMRKYLDILTPLKRFQKDNALPKMDSGYEEVPTWNGMEWIEDTDCNFDRVYILSLDGGFFEKYEVTPLKFDDKGGDILKWDPGYDGFVCYAKHYLNLGSRVPNAHVAITSLAVPTF